MLAQARRLLARLAVLRERKAVPFLAACLVVFVALSVAVRSPGMNVVDLAVTRAIQRADSPLLDHLAVSFTFLGNTLPMAVIGAFAAVTFLAFGKPWAAMLTAVSLLGQAVNLLLKDLVGRPRPDHDLVDVLLPALGLSFPSGHAMAAVMFYGFFALMAWVHLPRRKRRTFFVTAFVLIAICISLSRIYVGAHWLSDVLGGWTAGLFFLLLMAEFYKDLAKAELGPTLVIGNHAPARN